MSEEPKSHVHSLGPPQSIPVFNCRVIVTRGTEPGTYIAQAAELADLAETALTEREALHKLVAQFKKQVAEYTANDQAIPWLKPGRVVQAGEKEFFIGVHL